MAESLPTRGQSAGELKRQLELERASEPFLIHRDASGEQRLTILAGPGPLRIGRAAEAELRLDFDDEVSRLHAEIERVAGEWLLVDDGLSSNGSFVNGERIAGRRRLRDRDVVRLGRTIILYRNPAEAAAALATTPSSELPTRRQLTAMQLEVLSALCRPLQQGSLPAPATNREIAAELHLSVGTVKAHLRELFAKFGVADLPQTRKRIRLAELALINGVVPPPR